MGSLRSKLAQGIVQRLGLLTLIKNRIDKRVALQDSERHKILEKQEKRFEKYFENLRMLALEQNKRLRTLERRLQSNSDSIKQSTKHYKESSRTLEDLKKKIHLLVRARHHDQLSPSVKQLSATYALSEVSSHIDRSISGATLLTDPCPHTVINDVLPQNIYTAMSNDIPPMDFWRQGQLGRANWTIGEDTAPLRHETTWSFINNVIASTIVIPALAKSFVSALPLTLKT